SPEGPLDASTRTPPRTGTGGRAGRLRATHAAASARTSRSTRNFMTGTSRVLVSGRASHGGTTVLPLRWGRTGRGITVEPRGGGCHGGGIRPIRRLAAHPLSLFSSCGRDIQQ